MIAQNLLLRNICEKIFHYRHRAMVWVIFSTSSGLARCAFMPQSSAWRTSSAKALAASAMMGELDGVAPHVGKIKKQNLL